MNVKQKKRSNWIFSSPELRLIDLILTAQGHTGQEVDCEKCALHTKVIGILAHREQIKNKAPREGRKRGRPSLPATSQAQIDRILTLRRSGLSLPQIVTREGISYRRVWEALSGERAERKLREEEKKSKKDVKKAIDKGSEWV